MIAVNPAALTPLEITFLSLHDSQVSTLQVPVLVWIALQTTYMIAVHPATLTPLEITPLSLHNSQIRTLQVPIQRRITP